MRLAELISAFARRPFARVREPVTLIGHPYQGTGRAEDIRAMWRALRTAGHNPSIYNLYPDNPHEIELTSGIRSAFVRRVPGGIRIFHLNADEIDAAIRNLQARQPGVMGAGYNIVFPAWELPHFPTDWARQLERLDEVWAASAFVEESIRAVSSVCLLKIPNACEPHLRGPLGRAHFDLPNDAFLVLFFFDALSNPVRKNPWAALEAFGRVLAARPGSNVHLVLKMNHVSRDTATEQRLIAAVAPFGRRVNFLRGMMSDREIKSLIHCADCFLSLHRSEGFGRGLAEAMFFGKPVIATGWSGNMEFMNPAVSFPVSYHFVPVSEGEYPRWEGQFWAEPDAAEAAEILTRLIDYRELGRNTGRAAEAHMRTHFSDQALGTRYAHRLAEISAAKDRARLP